MIALLADESVSGNIVQSVRRLQPPVDLRTVNEIGLRSHEDPQILAWGAENNRVVITCDKNTMIGFAMDRVKARLPMPGLILVGAQMEVGPAARDLHYIGQCGEPEDLQNQVVYLPL